VSLANYGDLYHRNDQIGRLLDLQQEASSPAQPTPRVQKIAVDGDTAASDHQPVLIEMSD